MFGYALFIAPAFLLAMWAQSRVRSNFARASQIQAPMTGANAARRILDAAGLHSVGIEQVAGQLSDHYDPRAKVLRLSQGVYGVPSLAAVGIAAHEAGHALQDAKRYAPLVIRNAAVPLASFGGNFSMMAVMAGLIFPSFRWLLLVGIGLFSLTVFFQLINLPVEFDASNRAKRLLVDQGIVSAADMGPVNKVLNAAAWTYVAGTLQSILTLLYFVMRAMGSRSQ